MQQIAIFIKHRTMPGKREQVREVWEKHMAPAVSANAGHVAYFYCFDASDADVICAFQMYQDEAAAKAFLQTESYRAYLIGVEPLLCGPPEVTSLLPMWTKADA